MYFKLEIPEKRKSVLTFFAPLSILFVWIVVGHNWVLNQFVEIPRRSIIFCFLSLSAKAGFNLSPFEISCS